MRNVALLKGQRAWLIVEGVNLAAGTTERDADALASRLLRAKTGTGGRKKFLVGYLAPPDGLNGQAVLRDWIVEQTEAEAFDLLRERDEFHDAARDAATEVAGQAVLDLKL